MDTQTKSQGVKEFNNYLETHAKKQMLKFHCGHDIFCKGCGGVLDCKRAVELNFTNAAGKLVASKIICATCYDSRKDAAVKVASETQTTLEVIDGRELFKRRK